MIHRSHHVLKSALNKAVRRWRLIPENPMRFMDVPKYIPSDSRPLNAAEGKKFLAFVKTNMRYLMAYLALLYSLRRGEVLGLRWSNIDLDNRLLFIRLQLCQTPDGALEFKKPKGKRERVAPISNETELLLRAHKQRQEAAFDKSGIPFLPDTLVFERGDGSPFQPRSLTAWTHDTLGKLGIRARLHDLRHSVPTIMLGEGIDLKMIQEHMGHSNPMITAKIYQHVLQPVHRAMVEKVAAKLSDS